MSWVWASDETMSATQVFSWCEGSASLHTAVSTTSWCSKNVLARCQYYDHLLLSFQTCKKYDSALHTSWMKNEKIILVQNSLKFIYSFSQCRFSMNCLRILHKSHLFVNYSVLDRLKMAFHVWPLSMNIFSRNWKDFFGP